MKVSLTFKSTPDNLNRHKVYVRINDGKKRTYFPTKIRLEKKQLSNSKVVSHPQAKKFNEILRAEMLRYEFQKDKPKEKNLSFIKYVREAIPLMQQSEGTKGQYETQLRKLEAYRSEILFSELTTSFVYGYLNYLTSIGNSQNTRVNAFTFIRRFVKQAVKTDVIDKNPLAGIDPPKAIQTERTFLTKAEIDKLLEYRANPKKKRHFEVVTWFLIGIETGMRISDIKRFVRGWIQDGRLIFLTRKTNSRVGIPASERLLSYLDSIDYQPLSIQRKQYNNVLKKIAELAGIKKNLASHVARHSAAMRFANSGVSIEVAQAILGQADIKTTSIYYKISNQRIDQELKKLE